MKEIIDIYKLTVFCVTVVLCCSCSDHLENVDDIVVEELDRLSVTPTADAKIEEIVLPEDLDAGANWGVKAIVCDDGGYDLYPYSGKSVTLTSVNISGKCQDEKIQVWVVSTEDTIACAYITAREGSSMIPGVWSVNSEQCNY